MATIYDQDGFTLTQGLQGSIVCDEAIQTARRIATKRGETVYLHDDGTQWRVEPDGAAYPTALCDECYGPMPDGKIGMCANCLDQMHDEDAEWADYND